MGGYGEIRDAAIAVQDGRIAWLGRRADAPAAIAPTPNTMPAAAG